MTVIKARARKLTIKLDGDARTEVIRRNRAHSCLANGCPDRIRASAYLNVTSPCKH
jgi:hypothetical protein